MSSKKIPVYTTGDVNVPSVKYTPNSNTTYYSSYTGAKLNSHPTFNTPTDDPSGKNPTFHGGIAIDNNRMMCHQILSNSYNSTGFFNAFNYPGVNFY